jgi:hypothetical protein
MVWSWYAVGLVLALNLKSTENQDNQGTVSILLPKKSP